MTWIPVCVPTWHPMTHDPWPGRLTLVRSSSHSLSSPRRWGHAHPGGEEEGDGRIHGGRTTERRGSGQAGAARTCKYITAAPVSAGHTSKHKKISYTSDWEPRSRHNFVAFLYKAYFFGLFRYVNCPNNTREHPPPPPHLRAPAVLSLTGHFAP